MIAEGIRAHLDFLDEAERKLQKALDEQEKTDTKKTPTQSETFRFSLIQLGSLQTCTLADIEKACIGPEQAIVPRFRLDLEDYLNRRVSRTKWVKLKPEDEVTRILHCLGLDQANCSLDCSVALYTG